MKSTRDGSSQTDEDVFEDDSHDCPKCKSTNTRLVEIDEKLDRLLKLTDEFETYKSRVKALEDEQKKHARKPRKLDNIALSSNRKF